MKTFLIGLGLVVSIILQFFFLQGWQSNGIAPNILLSYIIILSIFIKPEQLLWAALIAGSFSDFYSSSEFGFYLGFYLLIAIVSKYLLKFGETEFSWWRPLVFLGICCALQSLIINFELVSSLGWIAVTKISFEYVTLTVIVGAIWYLLIKQTDEYVARINLSKLVK